MNKKLTAAVCCLLAAGFAAGLKYGCLFRNVFGVKCPSCGLSHAWLAFLTGKFKDAFAIHPMFWFPPLAMLCCCRKGYFVSKVFDFSVIAVLGAVYIALYFSKIF